MEKACEAAEVDHRGLHALRHSFASNLYARGVEIKVISKLLGHASTQITYDRYVHLFEGDLDDTLSRRLGCKYDKFMLSERQQIGRLLAYDRDWFKPSNCERKAAFGILRTPPIFMCDLY